MCYFFLTDGFAFSQEEHGVVNQVSSTVSDWETLELLLELLREIF